MSGAGGTSRSPTNRCHRRPLPATADHPAPPRPAPPPARRNQRKKAALAQQRELFHSVAAEKASLLASLRQVQQESYDVVEHLRKELVAKDRQLEQLAQQLEQVGGWSGRPG